MRHFPLLLLAVFVPMLAACHTTTSGGVIAFAPVAEARGTLPPPVIAKPFRREQLLTATVNGTAHTLHVLLEADGAGIALVGLSPLGFRLFKSNATTAGIKTQQFASLGELPPAQQVLADIMLAYWPVSAWQHHLPQNWILIDKKTTRELRDATGALVTEITYGADREPVQIRQHAFKYQIEITPLE